LYFYRIGMEAAVMRVRMEDRKLQKVVGLGGMKNTGWGGGLWLGVAPDNSPLLLRDTGTQEIYTIDWNAP
jgi:hypothetical protein